MENYQKELKKFGIDKKDYPKYHNANDFAKNFERCSLYKYGNVSYSANTYLSTNK